MSWLVAGLGIGINIKGKVKQNKANDTISSFVRQGINKYHADEAKRIGEQQAQKYKNVTSGGLYSA